VSLAFIVLIAFPLLQCYVMKYEKSKNKILKKGDRLFSFLDRTQGLSCDGQDTESRWSLSILSS